MNNITKRLLNDLFKAKEGLYIFTLYKRFNISPKELFLIIDNLTQRELIIQEEGRVILSLEGKDFIIKADLFINKRADKYESIPAQFLGRKIEINEVYFPISENTRNELLS